MAIIFQNARIMTAEEDIDQGYLFIDEGLIQAVGPDHYWVDAWAKPGVEVIDLAGLTILPGLIDLHVNGAGGADLLTGQLEAFQTTATFLLSHGVTAFVASLVSAPLEKVIKTLQAAKSYQKSGLGLPELLGIHLEGPYISPSRRGAHSAAHLRLPDIREFEELQRYGEGIIKMVTVAPELARALEFIKTLKNQGVIVALGHTNAPFALAKEAIDAGITHVTHMFNAMRPFHHREPGAVGAVLDSGGLTLEVISDGYHLSPAAQRLLLRLKGPEQLVLVSDLVSAAGATPKPGETYLLGNQQLKVEAGRVVDNQGALAGSLLTLNRAVPNFVDFAGCPPIRSLAMATANPAWVMGVSHRMGRLKPGLEANLAIVDDNFNVKQVYLKGEAVPTGTVGT